jgi:GntR family transcriptional regulator
MAARQSRKDTKQTLSAPPRQKSELSLEPLDKSSFTPMYFQIQTQLLEKIKSKQFLPGDLLPSEEELAGIYGVSRMTSRQALQGLTKDGYAYRQKGRGTFVLEPKVEKDITHLLGFSAEMRALGLKSSSRLLRMEVVSAPPEVASALKIGAGLPVLNLHRVRSAEGAPVAIEEVWLPQQQFPGIEKVDFVRRSLYATLYGKYGVRIGAADEVIEARPATPQEAKLLEIAPKSSLLVISRTLLSVEGTPVETGISLYRGDRYRAVIRIPGNSAG